MRNTGQYRPLGNSTRHDANVHDDVLLYAVWRENVLPQS